MKKEELERDISVALKFLYKVELTEEERTIYDKIYPWSNEPIYRYYKQYDLSDKKVLCITSSMDHALYAINAGTKEIDCTDRNRLCKYYAELKIALIMAYDEGTFFNHFKTKRLRILTKKIDLNELKPFLSKESYIFWQELTSAKAFRYNKRLFRSDGTPLRFLLNYEKLKENLEETKIKYFDEDIKELEETKKEKYDAIFLSNILEWELTDERHDAFKKIYNLLNDEGILFDSILKRDFNNTKPFIKEGEKIYTGPTLEESLVVRNDGVLVYTKK